MVEHVDLVEGQPVADEPLEFSEKGRHKSLVKIDHLSAAPAAVLLDEMDGAVKVRDGDQGLNVVFAALCKELAVELDAFAVGFGLVAVRVDPGPGDGQAVDRKTHLGKELYVLLKVMVHVDPFPGRVEVTVLEVEHLSFAAGNEAAVRTVRDHVDIGEAAAVEVEGAFALIGGSGAAPEKVCGKTHIILLLCNALCCDVCQFIRRRAVTGPPHIL